MSKTLFIYHRDCFDGFTAAWIYSRFVDGEAEFLPARYGDKAPYVNGRRVVVADFSYPREAMANMLAWSREMVVLDHHATAREALDGIVDEVAAGLDHISGAEFQLYHHVIFDMERAGAGLTWDELATDRHGTCEECGASQALKADDHQPGCCFSKRPALVNYVEDRDLWRLKLPNAREYMANVYAAPMTFEAWDELHSRSVNEMLSRGEAILGYMHQYGTKGLAEARTRALKLPASLAFDVDSRLWTVNLPYMNCSDYLSRLMEEKGSSFVMGYFCRGDGRWQFSLRSRNGFDCSQIAKEFGGGGHKEAAGFDVADLSEVFA